jgi:Ca-activated chloride channel family protein
MGATQGGVQDMSFARELVEQGKVPPADALIVEAMFSEHDLPLQGAPCSTVLCLRAAMGVAPSATEQPSAWVQVGMSSTVDPNSFERPTQAIVATVDVSGSMGWGYPNDQTAGSISRELLYAIAGELDEQDRFAMVTYGSTVQQATPWLPGGDGSIDAAIAALSEGGSTNMEGGLTVAYQLAGEALGQADEVRILLFTDVQPNVGATSAGAFETMAANGADRGIGLTVFGVGLGMGAEVFQAMSHLRGGNAFSLVSTAAVEPFMEDNWPWFVSPIAYDLSVQAEPSANLELAEAYGFPKSGDAPSASLDVATVFLSKRRGGLLLELAPLGDASLEPSQVDLSLSYVDQHGQPFSETLTASFDGSGRLDDRGIYMPQDGIAKAVSLALLVSGMRDAAELYGSDRAAAIERLSPTLDRFAADAAAIADADLQTEAEFWPQLLTLMEQGATQGSFYGEYGY